MELDDLSPDDKLRLLRFVCTFAWSDLEIADKEREFVAKLVGQFELDDEDQALVEEWLQVPPPAEDVDPTDVPREHRQLFLNTALQMVQADGVVDPQEIENFALFEQLLR